jgi:alpha-L-fucosidase
MKTEKSVSGIRSAVVKTGILMVVMQVFFLQYILSQPDKNEKSIFRLQQEFMDLRFGMYIHIGMGTFLDEDWADPSASPELFNPVKLDCDQWAEAAKSAGMKFGFLTTKHHSGFCIWDTKTTGYNVMNSPFNRDIVKEYADAFRKNGLKVCLYYSILDMHENIRKGWVTPDHTKFIKDQLTELLTNYGEITALIFDGWDASWSRLNYEEINFEEIYNHVKKLQPKCLISEYNAGKYPAQELFYTDIKNYEQNAGQNVARETNSLPAASALPINKTWFWKTTSPTEKVKDVDALINENLIPLNAAHCNFILNVSPNRNGLIDENAVSALKEIGQKWHPSGAAPELLKESVPVVASNLAKFQKANSSWSSDSRISDLGNDDNFNSSWASNSSVKQPWFEIIFDEVKTINMVIITEPCNQRWYGAAARITDYSLKYLKGDNWENIDITPTDNMIHRHSFDNIKTTKIRIEINRKNGDPAISEFCAYNEKRQILR